MRWLLLFIVVVSQSGWCVFEESTRHAGRRSEFKTLVRPTNYFPPAPPSKISCKVYISDCDSDKVEGGNARCSATIIDKKYLASSAHCALNCEGPAQVVCPGEAARTAKLSIPEGFRRVMNKGEEALQEAYRAGLDVAILAVEEPFSATPARLPKSEKEAQKILLSAGPKTCTTHGYGSGKQIGAYVPVSATASSSTLVKSKRPEGPDQKVFSEEGDSGAGLVCLDSEGQPVLLGMLLGKSKGAPETVFTSAAFNLPFIQKQLGQDFFPSPPPASQPSSIAKGKGAGPDESAGKAKGTGVEDTERSKGAQTSPRQKQVGAGDEQPKVVGSAVAKKAGGNGSERPPQLGRGGFQSPPLASGGHAGNYSYPKRVARGHSSYPLQPQDPNQALHDAIAAACGVERRY